MKNVLMTILRDRNTTIEDYRIASDQLSTILAVESSQYLPKSIISLSTPLAQTQGEQFLHDLVLIVILRSGLALLPSFMNFYPKARIGFIGAYRDEVTALPQLYYSNIPAFGPDTPILILDPMIATGGSAALSVKIIKDAGGKESQISLIGFIASPEGIEFFKNEYPEVNLLVAQIDKQLNVSKFILPGLGDFGDRYFGTEAPKKMG